jgi:hypothetical protein
MKNRTNGAAPQAAKATMTTLDKPLGRRGKTVRDVVDELAAERDKARLAKEEANADAYNGCTKKLTIEVSPNVYGMLAGGAVHHAVTVEGLVSALVCANVCDWQNNAFSDVLDG